MAVEAAKDRFCRDFGERCSKAGAFYPSGCLFNFFSVDFASNICVLELFNCRVWRF